jgi:hypothetical protein
MQIYLAMTHKATLQIYLAMTHGFQGKTCSKCSTWDYMKAVSHVADGAGLARAYKAERKIDQT